MSQMPGTVKSARALLFVVGAGNTVAALWLVMAAATLRTGAMGQLVIGLLLLVALPFGTLAAAAIVIAAKFTTGGHRVRKGAVVVGSLLIVVSLITAGTAISAKLYDGTWGIAVVAGALVIVLSTGQDTRDWFDRPRP
ncbi:hypothetical protein OIE61_05285 [Streptomyces sp. NBC_01762]|uniref:hypothetical protein n=1 Tax=unclassified Streptomyces TaxID=2593676 RepID=UPI002DD7D1E0|nr:MULTISPECIES: hypothetical protein [unclassified Streptomyces]WSC43413.1 hypothetical protein OIE61_05285 [Streptomyces sp. NBC_01762]WSD22950.1 hypothetical protein OHA26_05340 [Streptomyces sp. NBC_01751]